jgi:hypothetical protein
LDLLVDLALLFLPESLRCFEPPLNILLVRRLANESLFEQVGLINRLLHDVRVV